MGCQQGILGHQSAVDGADQQLLDKAGLGIRYHLAVAMIIGAKEQELGRLGYIGLMPRQFGKLAAQGLVGHPDDAVGLQKAGAGGGLSRTQDLVKLGLADGLGSKLTNGAMGKNKVESRVHVASI